MVASMASYNKVNDKLIHKRGKELVHVRGRVHIKKLMSKKTQTGSQNNQQTLIMSQYFTSLP